MNINKSLKLLILLTIPKIILYVLVFFFNILIGSKILSLFLALFSMIFGFYKAILQINLQRFLAYTGIGSNGYFLSLTVLSNFFAFISLILYSFTKIKPTAKMELQFQLLS